jgi:hypothetical protein
MKGEARNPKVQCKEGEFGDWLSTGVDKTSTDFSRGADNTRKTSVMLPPPPQKADIYAELDPFDFKQTGFDYKDGVKVILQEPKTEGR